MASGKLVISLLGPPEIRLGEKIIQIKRRMFRYLVFYLACQAEPVSRESLCDMFWPDDDEDQSRKNLREMVSKLRRDLPIEDLIHTEKEYVSFNQAKVEVDVIRFEETINLIRKNLDLAVSGRINDQLYRAVRDSLSLWRTDHFLGGASTTGSVPFQNWITGTAETLQYWRQMMVEWMADHCIMTGNNPEALNWLTQARQFDRTNTEINALLLTCLRDLGMWSEAIYLCNMLKTDYLSSEESAMPASLAELTSRVKDEARVAQNLAPITRPFGAEARGNFIGRETILAEMNNTLNRGGILMIRGDNGSGKTELLKYFHEHLEAVPFIISYNACSGDEKVPYRTLVEGLRRVVKKEFWRNIDPPYALALLPLFPELLDYREDLNIKDFFIHEENARLISEAFLHIISKAVPRKKSLLLIDNAQWMDPETLAVIGYSQVQLMPGVINAIIMTCGTGDIPPHLEALLGRDYPRQVLRMIKLEPLGEKEISGLVYRDFHIQCSPEVTRRLLALSGGNPRYLQAMLTVIREKKIDPGSQEITPEDLMAEPLVTIVSRKVKQLGAQETAILKQLAILGEQFSPVLIETTTGLDTQSLTGELKLLCDQGFLITVRDEAGEQAYRFAQGIIAWHFLAAIDPMEQRELHLKAVDAIIACEGNGTDQAASLAQHLSAAGEYPRALKYWLRAGLNEKGQLHKEKAYEYFTSAFNLIQRLGITTDPEDIYTLTNEWGDLALQLEDMDTFANVNTACLRAGEKLYNNRLIGFGKSGIGWVAHVRGYFEIAEKFLSQAIAIFEYEKDQADLLDALFRLGTIHFSRQDFAEVIHQYDRVRQLALGFADLDNIAFIKKASGFLIYAYCIAGRLDVAQAIADEGFTIANTLGEPNYLMQLKAAEVIIRYYTGELVNAMQGVEEILPELHSMSLDWWVFAMLTTMGQTAFEMGDLTTCVRIAETIATFDSTALSAGWGGCFRRYLWGETLSCLGNLDEAKVLLRENLEVKTEKFIEWLSRLSLAKVDLRRGNYRECRKILEGVLEEAETRGFVVIAQGAMLELLRAALEQGNDRNLQGEWKKYAQDLAASQLRGIRISFTILDGNRLVLLHRPVKAKAAFCMAYEEASTYHYLWKGLSALEGLIALGCDREENIKTGRRILEKAKFECEIPELEKPLSEAIKAWPNLTLCQ
jgi:DNA-binding SARP family transcriptional activator/tetratricopeptide (TPR) repeat protein